MEAVAPHTLAHTVSVRIQSTICETCDSPKQAFAQYSQEALHSFKTRINCWVFIIEVFGSSKKTQTVCHVI
jgi:hypothetical protein